MGGYLGYWKDTLLEDCTGQAQGRGPGQAANEIIPKIRT